MPRLHTLYLPRNGEGMPFAFILDQTNPMTEAAITAWKGFAEKCGACDIMFTAETIDIDPEISDGWQPDDDQPVDYLITDHSGCHHPPLLDILTAVREAHAAAWVPWEPANLDPESPRISTHREEVCPALNNGAEGCPMHAPILHGDWAGWPYYASHNPEIGTTITRICEHGITHPTPEEYPGGLDVPHLCDGCQCAPEDDRDRYAIVVSDLANTRLPRGTLLLGVKDDPGVSAEWPDRLAKQNRDEVGRFINDPTPVTAPPATVQMGDLSGWMPPQPSSADLVAENWFAPVPITHEGASVGTAELHPDGRVRGTFAPVAHEAATLTTEMLAKAPLSGDWARIQPLGPDGEPVGEAKDYPLTGPVKIAEKTYDDLPVPQCDGGGENTRCTLDRGHDGLHEFGPFNRV